MRYVNLIREFKNWPDYFLSKWSSRKPASVSFVTRSGISIEVPAQLMVEFKEVFFAQDYARHWQATNQAGHIVDIGANVGFFTLFAAHRCPRALVHSYEPVPANFRQLHANLQRNPNINVVAHQQAVGAKAGSFSMSLNSDLEFTTAARLDHTATGRSIEVECASFSSVIQSLPDGRCDFLKLDCEGAEYEILYGSPGDALAGVRQFAMECHHRDDDLQNTHAMQRFLQRQGFVVYAHGSMLHGRRPLPN